MEVSGLNIRQCAVPLSRCDFSSCRDTALLEGGAPAAPYAFTSTTASYAADYVQEYDTAPTIVIKTEDDDKDVFTTQEPDSVVASLSKELVTDISWLTKEMEDQADEVMVKQELEVGPTVVQPPPAPRAQENRFIVKIEYETDGVIVRQELEVGPTVLQPPPAPLAQVDPDPRSTTSSGGGAAPTPLYMLYFPPIGQIEAQGDYCEESSGVPSVAGFVLDSEKIDDDCQRALNERSGDCTGGEDTAEDKREGGQLYECHYYKYNIKRKSSLINHISRDMAEKLYKCKQCQYRTYQHLKKHMRSDMGPFYTCEVCQYRTSLPSHLKTHMRTHTYKKSYTCKQCQYSTSQLQYLKRHMQTKTHRDKRRYTCEQCEYSTSYLAHLKRHICSHTGKKRYTCEQCEYSTSYLAHLKRHIRSHTGKKRYTCKQCEYNTSYLHSFKRHVRTHKGDKLYKCEECHTEYLN